MKRRRSVFHIIATGLVAILCSAGSTKSAYAFDLSNTTTEVVYRAPRSDGVEQTSRTRSTKRSTVELQGSKQRGMASWYGGSFNRKPTASGEPFDQNAYTIAHKTLPFGTVVSIENPKTGVVAYARVNDRGPFVPGRIVDLSYGLAKKLGIDGVSTVVVTVL